MIGDAETGLYLEDGTHGWRCIHRYQDGDYGLEDIVECFGVGKRLPAARQGDVLVQLSGHDATQLKAMADAQSFDYEPEFIEMCLAIARHIPAGTASVKLRANF